ELRGRFLNPEWLKGQMEHDYAGARTMGSEFLEYLWGWQVTNPTLVGDWAWEEVKAVYIDDRYDIQLDEFLSKGHNAHVKSNMLAIMLVAVKKGFWQADQQTIQQLASEFSDLVKLNGLPGSGHTDPDNPMLPWLEQHLSPEQWQTISKAIDFARAKPPQQKTSETYRVAEIELTDDKKLADPQQQKPESDPGNILSEQKTETSKEQEQTTTDKDTEENTWQRWLIALLLLLILLGFYQGFRTSKKMKQQMQQKRGKY
ncbi:MAG TPA: cobaltochelatase subunit CobN, partial [Leucothrix sp.]|nr:cobaltochelatase subunit CobN [Leucothrix sp.]